ncbi:glycosyl hydrolase family 18 [Streptomyces sp. SPB074]|uniref:glycosyl hydrolase family 18 n=1 Tax=Streptomyces sp. (strain SPB074) TaxID=465543 RepID=UPI00017F208B|nr:glycosyl hydrolase family 18 [Streptomyces sp. SPB074]
MPPPPRRSPLLALACALPLLLAACGGAPADSADDAPARRVGFAPYVSAESASALDATAHPDEYRLAFAVADGRRCVPVWGGTEPVDDPAVVERAGRLGRVRVSFGGEAGTELARACGSVDALAAAYRRAPDAAGTDRADFDIEGGTLGDTAANARRARALARLQADGGLDVLVTLPVMPEGLEADARALLRGLRAAGVRVGEVNIMTMSYGSAYPDSEGPMSAYGERAARAAHGQLRAVLGWSSRTAWRRLRLTVMPGVNDVPHETFTRADARRTHAFAVRAGLGGLSLWASFRDRPCARGESSRERCTGVAQEKGEFARLLAGGGAAG